MYVNLHNVLHHSVRFMAYIIYVTKIEKKSERFPLSQLERSQMYRLSKFAVLIHSDAFLLSRLVSALPCLYVKNINISLLQEYKEEDSQLANTVTPTP